MPVRARKNISLALSAGLLLLLTCTVTWAAKPVAYALDGDWIWLGGDRGRPEMYIGVAGKILQIGDVGRKHAVEFEVREANEYFIRTIKPAGPDGEYDKRTGMSFYRVTDDALVMTSGDVFSGVLVRKGAPFAPFKRTRPTGRWSLTVDEGRRIVYDFDRNIMQRVYPDSLEEEKFTTSAVFSFPEKFSFSEEYSFPEGAYFSLNFSFGEDAFFHEGGLVVRNENEHEAVMEQISDDVLLVYDEKKDLGPRIAFGKE